MSNKFNVINISGMPVLDRSVINNVGDSLFNNKEVNRVKIEVEFSDCTTLIYKSKHKELIKAINEIESECEEDEY